MTTTTRTLDNLQEQAQDLLRQYGDASQDVRTPLLRQLAEVLFEIRLHFNTAEGEPDYLGRTYAYRNFVGEIYRSVNLSREEAASIQSAVRYHVGGVLRDRLDQDTLHDLGLIERSPRERSLDRHTAKSALLNTLTSREVSQGSLLSLSAAYTVLTKVQPENLVLLEPREAEIAEATLRDIGRVAGRLLASLEG